MCLFAKRLKSPTSSRFISPFPVRLFVRPVTSSTRAPPFLCLAALLPLSLSLFILRRLTFSSQRRGDASAFVEKLHASAVKTVIGELFNGQHLSDGADVLLLATHTFVDK